MVKYSDGFKIAEIDLKLRGPGDIFGTKQSGFPELKYTNIIEDAEIILEAKLSAFKLIEVDPKLEKKFSILWVARAERLKRPETFLKLAVCAFNLVV